MLRLRPTDGTAPHRRNARYHIDALMTGGAPIHAKLAGEMTLLYADLRAKARASEDAADESLGAAARCDAAEIVVENAVRKLDIEARRADQNEPSLNAQKSIFPRGFGPIIAPEGALQLQTLPGLYVRVAPFLDHPEIAGAVDALKAAEKSFEDRLKDEETARATWSTCFAMELEARRKIREQLDSAYGLLRDFYKGRTMQAEDFFHREKKLRKPAKSDVIDPTQPAPVAPAAPTGGTP
ncbi:MAG: hypothetical protein QM820_01475 [Minicystis sp.]